VAIRVLIAIPHYFAASGENGRYGSITQRREQREAALRVCLSSLREMFGGAKCVFELANPRAQPANALTACELNIVVCTTSGRHVLDSLGVSDRYFEHYECDVDPQMLGFECHEILRERLDGYDYYGYMEDDLVCHDGWFLEKLKAFRDAAGPRKLLLPSRYERTRSFPFLKAYIDGTLHERFTASLKQPHAAPQEILNAFGVPVTLRRARNPHSGCFFLDQMQMATWASKPYFLDREVSFVSPLESAAT
jgi:hypothetical protein